jgi:membrane protein DedA with SNARE-associated domain
MDLAIVTQHLPALLAGVFGVERVEHWMEVGGPVVVFFLLFLCGLGLPLPEDLPILIAGYFVAHGEMELVSVAILAWCGIMLGDCLLYRFGKNYGLNITKLPLIGKHFTPERIIKLERLFDQWGVLVIALGRLIPGVRGAMVVAAGAIRFGFFRFFLVDGLAALVSGGLFLWLGWFLGKRLGNLQQIEAKVQFYQSTILWTLCAAGVILLIYLWFRHRKHKSITEIALDKAVAVAEHHPLPGHGHGHPQHGHAGVDPVAK